MNKIDSWPKFEQFFLCVRVWPENAMHNSSTTHCYKMRIEYEILFNRFYLTNWINNWIGIHIMKNWINITFNERKPSLMIFLLDVLKRTQVWTTTINWNEQKQDHKLHCQVNVVARLMYCTVLNSSHLFWLIWCAHSICVAQILARSLRLSICLCKLLWRKISKRIVWVLWKGISSIPCFSLIRNKQLNKQTKHRHLEHIKRKNKNPSSQRSFSEAKKSGYHAYF